jgi:hypothetical protein
MPPEVGDAMVAALRAAVLGDVDAKAAALDVLFDHDMVALYAACRTWADTIASLTGLDGEGLASVEFVHTGTDRQVEPEEAITINAALVWVGRFLAAHCNEDDAMCLALFTASSPEQLADNLLSLLDTTASVVRRASIPDPGSV